MWYPSLLAFVPPAVTAGNPVLLTPQRSFLPPLSQQARALGAAVMQLRINLCNSKQEEVACEACLSCMVLKHHA
jgi:hypothetical protein